MVESTMRVKAICVYPIKSLRGCTLPSLTASPAGFSYDRRFVLQRVRDDKPMIIGRFLEMSLFTTELSPAEKPEKILVRYTLDHVFDRREEEVSQEVLEVPLEPDWKTESLKAREVNLHSSPATGYEMGQKCDEWFSKRFGYEVRLIYLGENRRQVLGSVTPNAKPQNQGVKEGGQSWFGSAKASVGGLINSVTSYAGAGGDEDKENEGAYRGVDEGIGWADVAPFLVINNTSYENAAARLGPGGELDVFKFRPNLIVEGAEEDFEEDFWAELAIGDDAETRVVLTSNCARCASLNVDFDTGKAGQGEAGKILKLLQKDRRVDPGMKYSPVFGRYGFLASKGPVKDYGEVDIKVGDVVRVMRRNDERTRFQWPGVSTDN